MRSSFTGWSIRRIVEGYREKTLRPLEVAEVCIRRMAEMEPCCLAWEYFDADSIRHQANIAQQRIDAGESLRPLEAIPVGVKDIFNTIDFPTQMGSPLWKDFTPGNDARAVFHVKRAGGIVAGKTVTAEFAVHTLGKTLNPHDSAHNPGTSSSGSAAAVAAGVVPIALGTQTAGSIIRPASYCGIYGCKPSFGLVPRTGMLKTTDSLDSVGFFTGASEDLQRVWDVLRIHGRDYPLAEAALNDPARNAKPADRPWRVALVRTYTWDAASDYAQEALLTFARRLGEQSGFEVVEVELPNRLERAHEVHALIYDCSLAYYFKDEHKKAELVSPIMNDIIKRGQSISCDDYTGALREQERMAADMDDFLQSFDVMISLSTAGAAPLRDEKERIDPSLIWTLAQLPSVSAPAFLSPFGLPFGLQISARRYNDVLLFGFIEHLCELGMIPKQQHPIIE